LRLREEHEKLKKENEQLLNRAKRVPLFFGWDSASPSATLYSSTPSLPVTPRHPPSSTSVTPAATPSPLTATTTTPSTETPHKLRRTISTDTNLSPYTSTLTVDTLAGSLTTPKKRGGTFRLPLPKGPFMTPQSRSTSMRVLPREQDAKNAAETTTSPFLTPQPPKSSAVRLKQEEEDKKKEREREKEKERERRRAAVEKSGEKAKGKTREEERRREKEAVLLQQELRKRMQQWALEDEKEKELLRLQVDGLQQKLMEEQKRRAELEVLNRRANEKLAANLKRSAAFADLVNRVSLRHSLGLGLLVFFTLIYVVVRLFVAFSPTLFPPS